MPFAFDSPWYLLLLLLLPVIWVVSYRSISGLGFWRCISAITLRSLVFLLLVFALADIQYQKKTDKMTVVYLLDQSMSIPEDHRQLMKEFVNESVDKFRQEDRDRVAVIVFGRDAEVEIPPLEYFVGLRTFNSLLDPQYTNMESALERAQALFPEETAKRIVVVTDGNENLGDALSEARALADAGISIDVVPVDLPQRSEASVEKVDLPNDVRQGQPFELRVVLNHDAAEGSPPLPGTLRIKRKSGEQETIIAEMPVELDPGKSRFSATETIDRPDFYTYEAEFSPADPSSDTTAQNNEATAFTHVRGKGHVLVIEDWAATGQFDYMVDRLRTSGLEVTLMPSNQLFSSLADLQRYDTVVLANVPRSSTSGDDIDEDGGANFTDEQIAMLVRNTEELGCGLVMLGGRNSFGAGGWANTELEKAMPVDFQIKSTKVVPVGALAMMMHASEMPQGNYWQKRIAIEAIKVLGDRDYCGMIQWNMSDQWMWGRTKGGMLTVGPNRNMMLGSVDQMNVGDMPAFEGAMKMVANSFVLLDRQTNKPATKHMIIISDGDPTAPSAATLKQFKQLNVKITTVAVGAHGTVGTDTMRQIAEVTGGKYYMVRNANALPRIYQREARRVARPLVKDLEPPQAPRMVSEHEIVRGISPSSFPPLDGYVLTTVKDSALVEVILRSPTPAIDANNTLLAAWPYGLGKTVAFTTDAGHQLSKQWDSWEQYDQFYSQMIRWSMRPTGDTGNFSVATSVSDGRTRVVIDALDKNEEFINVTTMGATVVGPDMQPVPLVIEQVAPGRYIGEFDSISPGSYMISILPGGDQAMIRTGVNVSYSQEFKDRETNLSLLRTIANLEPTAGKPGELIGAAQNAMLTGDPKILPALLNTDPYRRDMPPAISRDSIWPWMVLIAATLFFFDVFIRRVQIGFEWLAPVWAYIGENLLGREREAEAPATMSRLQSRKREVQEQYESRRSATRFEAPEEAPDSNEPAPLAGLEEKPTQRTSPKPTPKVGEEKKEQESYTSRLLKAKKDVWKDRDK
ncbi:VWA domain-containing protein [Aeoliella mucimassa]|uniref:von Willebrand factor type A domain protein n=1 Tax=Aeoliella mucimassa TaxID=2527972 RepID=A0A518ASP5_9BACT|nr:VWA domain-containing protein [Aeoliella mucimassa]QDU57707.1 von Willebrand factor type A domain protein [Aeoliella mucimassa]